MGVEDVLANWLLQENGDAILLENGDNLLLELDSVPGLPSFEFDIVYDPEGQAIVTTLVGSTILTVDLFNSSHIIVDREFAVTVDLWNSNTTITLSDR
jgi:hypothetical protein